MEYPKHIPVLFLLMGAFLQALGCSSSGPLDPPPESFVESRPFRGRLVGFSHKPFDPDNDLELPQHTELVGLQLAAEKEVGRESGQQPRIALVRILLLLEDFEEAIEILVDSPESARFCNALSVAYLLKSRKLDSPLDALTALSFALEAIHKNPRLPEARFNLALALEALSLREYSAPAWSAYVKLDPGSPWRTEAERHLEELASLSKGAVGEFQDALESSMRAKDLTAAKGLAARFHQRARTYVEEELLPEWARASSEGREQEAAQLRERVGFLGEALKEASGDSLLQDIHSDLEATGGLDDELTNGYLDLSRGSKFYRDKDYERALLCFLAASRRLRNSAGSYLGRYHEALCRYHLGRKDEDKDALRRRLSGLLKGTPDRYKALRGRLLKLIGLVEGSLRNLSGYVRYNRQAVFTFQEICERENEASARRELANGLNFLGDAKSALDERLRAAALMSPQDSTQKSYLLFATLAVEVSKLGLHRAANYFHSEAVRFARLDAKVSSIAQSLRLRAVSWNRIGQSEKAFRDLEEAKGLIKTLPEEGRQAIEVEIAIVEGRLLLEESPEKAVELLSSVLDDYGRSVLEPRLQDIYLWRARAYCLLDQDELALADLRSGIEEIEKRRSEVDKSSRTSYLDASLSLYDEIVGLLLATSDDREALLFAEDSRSRLLRDALPDEDRFARREELELPVLPADTALVFYAVLPERIAAWVLKEGVLSGAFLSSHGANDLRHLVTRLSDAAQRRESTPVLSGFLEDLSGILIGPIAQELEGVENLIIVPDKILWAIPFAALSVPEGGLYLFQDFRIALVPSISILNYLLEQPLSTALTGEESILILGNPDLSMSAFDRLRNLPEAGTEAHRISEFYGKRSTSLVGERATETAFRRHLPRVQIVHVAAHAFPHPEDHLLSSVLLAPDQENDGIVTAGDLYELVFPRMRLVVLSGCETGAIGSSSSEAGASLARPFLAQGVPFVIASLWTVEDLKSREFMVDFHRELRRSKDPAQALRKTQDEWSKKQDASFADWAGFQLFGLPFKRFQPSRGPRLDKTPESGSSFRP